MGIEITKSTDSYDGTTRYSFFRVDEDGDRWDLGSASWSADDDGDGVFSGRFDTDTIYFRNEDELVRIIEKRKPADKGSIYFA